jgi:hypothetical protein
MPYCGSTKFSIMNSTSFSPRPERLSSMFSKAGRRYSMYLNLAVVKPNSPMCTSHSNPQ